MGSWTEEERWLPVVGFKDYSVSDLGRVRGEDRLDAAGRRWQGRLLTPTPNKDGYLTVPLRVGGKPYRRLVHRLVLEAFVGPCPVGMEACHDPDRDPANVRLVNLRWGTKSDNQYDMVRHGTHDRARRTHCPRKHPLAAPNLIVSNLPKRGCLACDRARSYVALYPDAGDLQTVSDRYYAQIMEEMEANDGLMD